LLRDALNNIRSLSEGLPRLGQPLPEPKPHWNFIPTIDWFWVKTGVKGGLSAVISIVLLKVDQSAWASFDSDHRVDPELIWANIRASRRNGRPSCSRAPTGVGKTELAKALAEFLFKQDSLADMILTGDARDGSQVKSSAGKRALLSIAKCRAARTPSNSSPCERQHRKTRELTPHSRKAGQGRRDSS
jgi:hypothetical protein